MNVKNGACIRRLAWKSLQASRNRNRIAVLAIALTTVLFTCLFTIALSINDGFQQANFRQAGGFNHGTFKYLTEAQADALKDDPLIRSWGMRRFLGMAEGDAFHKSHVEVSWSDANTAHWMFCDPVEGRLPAEGTDEAATDTAVLAALGIEPKLGAQFTMDIAVDGHLTAQTFTLCGWWERDEAIAASHVLVPESRVDAVLADCGVDPNNPGDARTGLWNLDVMLKSGSGRIAEDFETILANHGFQDQTPGDNYINTGVNWGYTGAQLADGLDAATVSALAVVILLIVLTGYLIIYNIFQISVAGDIRFYGLLKTIGTTPRQLRRIIRLQALALAAVGIPIGLVGGWLLGVRLAPVVVAQLDGVDSVVTLNPVIFAGSAAFALATVLLSCRKPGRMAARVSPIEAVRYTEGGGCAAGVRRRKKGASLFAMAQANLGRNRRKTAVTVTSLSLAVVLLAMTATLARGFDMDKYVSRSAVCDFMVSDAAYFQTGELFSADTALPDAAVADIDAEGGITDGGVVYGLSTPALEYVTEDYFRQARQYFNDEETLDRLVELTDHNADGLLATDVQLFGMSDFALDHLTVLEGDLSKLYEDGGNYIAAVYSADEYGNTQPDSHWAKVGDTVTLRYVERYEYYDPDTGAVYPDAGSIPDGANYVPRAAEYRDVTYTVAALVDVPSSLSYRYYGPDEFVLNAETFARDTGTRDILYYAFDTTDEANAGMEAFLHDYTQNVNPALDYESKATYAAEFESTRSMFLLLGGALSVIVGLVGVLNFFNAILTGIIARRREFAVLQSIGMTGRQLKTMLVYEGLLYALGAVAVSLVLSVALGPVAFRAVESLFWFFTYRLTLAPFLIIGPVFAVLGVLVPLGVYRVTARSTIVERLRTE